MISWTNMDCMDDMDLMDFSSMLALFQVFRYTLDKRSGPWKNLQLI